MDTLSQLRPTLTKLRMSGILEHLEERIRQATENKLGYSEFLFSVMQDEYQRRETQALALRLKRSNLHPAKTMETFDLDANEKYPKTAIRELATGLFVEKAENVIVVGPSGVGKTHLVQALGHEVCRRGHKVLNDRLINILSYLNTGRADDTHKRRLRSLIEVPLLIMDDFGLSEFSAKEQIDFYEIVSGRYESKSTILTSNRDVPEWLSLFSNPLLGSATVDRLVHRGVRITIDGPSYRTKEAYQLNTGYGLTELKY